MATPANTTFSQAVSWGHPRISLVAIPISCAISININVKIFAGIVVPVIVISLLAILGSLGPRASISIVKHVSRFGNITGGTGGSGGSGQVGGAGGAGGPIQIGTTQPANNCINPWCRAIKRIGKSR